MFKQCLLLYHINLRCKHLTYICSVHGPSTILSSAGRAGNKGTAYTFISEEEDKFAPDLVKALQESNAPVPKDLMQLADNFNSKHARGEVQARGSGYGGSGFKFDVGEEEARNAERRVSMLCAPYTQPLTQINLSQNLSGV